MLGCYWYKCIVGAANIHAKQLIDYQVMLGFSPLNSWFQTLLRYYLKLTNVTIGRNPPLEAVNTPLEALDTFVVKDQYSHLVYPNICITKQIFTKLFIRIANKIMGEKKPLLHKIVCFQNPN